MTHLNGSYGVRLWLVACALTLFIAGCGGGGGGGGRDPILGLDGAGITAAKVILAPTITAVMPTNNATGVAINTSLITAAFSEPVSIPLGSASFTLSCAAPCATPTGLVSIDSSNKIGTFALAAGTGLNASTLYTATVVGARSVATGLTMVSPYIWQFTTGAAPDTTRPRVGHKPG